MQRNQGGGRTTRKTARKQRDVLRDVLLSAGMCATWLTLDELAKLTNFPPASISAQLRHLRKARFGGYCVAKRRRMVNTVLRADGAGPLWEYAVAPVQYLFGKGSGPRRRVARKKRNARALRRPAWA